MKLLHTIVENEDQSTKVLDHFHFLSNNIKFIKPDEVNNFTDKRLFHFYFTFSYISHEIKDNKNLLVNNDIISLLQNNENVFVVYVLDHECDSEDIFDVIETYTKKNSINSNKIYIINGNQKLNFLKNEINSNVNFHISNKLQEVVSRDVSRNSDEILFDKKYLFQCFNGTVQPHRLTILSFLKEYDLLEKTNWSFLKINKNYEINFVSEILSNDNIKKYEKSIRFIIENESKLADYENFNFFTPPFFLNYSRAYENNTYKFSYFNIVNESQFTRKKTIHITEKTLVPFYFYQIPIFVATPGHVSKIRELYNLDLFDEIIDHSYDDEIDDEKRIFMILDQILKMSNFDIQTYYKKESTITRLNNNRNIIKSLSNNIIDVKFFETLLD